MLDLLDTSYISNMGLPIMNISVHSNSSIINLQVYNLFNTVISKENSMDGYYVDLYLDSYANSYVVSSLLLLLLMRRNINVISSLEILLVQDLIFCEYVLFFLHNIIQLTTSSCTWNFYLIESSQYFLEI